MRQVLQATKPGAPPSSPPASTPTSATCPAEENTIAGSVLGNCQQIRKVLQLGVEARPGPGGGPVPLRPHPGCPRAGVEHQAARPAGPGRGHQDPSWAVRDAGADLPREFGPLDPGLPRGWVRALVPAPSRVLAGTPAHVLDLAVALKTEAPDRTAAQVAVVLASRGGFAPSSAASVASPGSIPQALSRRRWTTSRPRNTNVAELSSWPSTEPICSLPTSSKSCGC